MGEPFTPDELKIELSYAQLGDLDEELHILERTIKQDFPKLKRIGTWKTGSVPNDHFYNIGWERLVDRVDSLYREYGDMDYPDGLDRMIAILEASSDDPGAFYRPITEKPFAESWEIPCELLTEEIIHETEHIPYKYIEDDIGSDGCVAGITNLYFGSEEDAFDFLRIFDGHLFNMFPIQEKAGDYYSEPPIYGLSYRGRLDPTLYDVNLFGESKQTAKIRPSTTFRGASFEKVFDAWKKKPEQYYDIVVDEKVVETFTFEELMDSRTWDNIIIPTYLS